MSVTGVSGEERNDFTRAENKRLRARSARLAGELVRPVKWAVVGSGVLIVLGTLGSVAGPALIALGIDQALPALTGSGDWGPVLLIAGAYVGIGLLGGLFRSGYFRTSARISQRVIYHLRVRLFRQTQALSMSFHEKYTSGRVIARQTSDLDTLREFLDSGIEDLVSGVLFMVFTAAALARASAGTASW